ncbi:LPXTG cell wall anchor domain-containing protein [Natronosporangium hydrolyticum]|uniref:LPXTG cell wall anchor domain-containing protein n=1 Tax=Natronosporangium hydrolyticum TaxID=2811111 RepID=A0A895Y764_9ACTN|nr:LPXTG cell wall anchor domain-containing protein [Natronosporangium hydrolyticum]QSB13567.1 LPXTG cell wall anchor domain-containing protein [Natronosporangium hydrolyticum]
MKQTSLSRRLLAGAAGLALAATSAFAFAAPAAAQDDARTFGGGSMVKKPKIDYTAECDPATGNWTIEWTVSPRSNAKVEITEVKSDGESVDALGDIAVGTKLSRHSHHKPASVSGTQEVEHGVESATLEVEFTGKWGWKTKTKSKSTTVDLEDCKDHSDEGEPLGPDVVYLVDCTHLVFIIDNSQGEADTVVTFSPNQEVAYGEASGFSYTIDEDGEVVPVIEDDASVATDGEASAESPVVVEHAPGDGATAVGFHASEGLEISVGLTLNGEELEFGDAIVSFNDEVDGLDCEVDGGEGGEDELPVTGSSTLLIAGGALALLALGGGMFMVARRRRVTFTA